jgi:hypothetical protein
MTPDRIREINGIGIGFAGTEAEKVRDIRIYPENSTVLMLIEMNGQDGLQYLTPQEAMSFAKAFERCAIAALKDGAT